MGRERERQREEDEMHKRSSETLWLPIAIVLLVNLLG